MKRISKFLSLALFGLVFWSSSAFALPNAYSDAQDDLGGGGGGGGRSYQCCKSGPLTCWDTDCGSAWATQCCNDINAPAYRDPSEEESDSLLEEDLDARMSIFQD